MEKIISFNRILIFLLLLSIGCGKKVDTPTDNGGTNTNTPVTPPVIGGASANFKDTTTINDGAVTLQFSKTSPCFPSSEIFAFSATVTGAPTGVTYNWDFGDGQKLTGNPVRTIYKIAGNYTVILDIKNSSGNSLNKSTISVKAWGQQVTPHAAFASQIFDVNFVNNMSFTSSATVPNGAINSYFWDWGDGTKNTTVNQFINKNFVALGSDRTYNVKHVVTANSGCKDSVTVPVFVQGTYTIAGDFNAVQFDGCTAEYFMITSNATGVPAGAVFTWDFADASGLQTGNPIRKSFTYQNDYDVKMTVTLNGRQIYKTSKTIKAFGQNIKPRALMLKNVASETATTVKWAFYSQSNIPHGYLTGYRWEHDDALVDDNFNTYIERTYNKGTSAVNRSVKLIVTSNTGCKDTTTAFITIPAR
jgi:PKD repeat protein